MSAKLLLVGRDTVDAQSTAGIRRISLFIACNMWESTESKVHLQTPRQATAALPAPTRGDLSQTLAPSLMGQIFVWDVLCFVVHGPESIMSSWWTWIIRFNIHCWWWGGANAAVVV